MASTRLRQFDPAEHPGNVHDAFCEFVDRFAYEYEAVAKLPPAGTEDVAAWTGVDKRKQLLGRYSSWNLQIDYEDETTVQEHSTITFTDAVKKPGTDRLAIKRLHTLTSTNCSSTLPRRSTSLSIESNMTQTAATSPMPATPAWFVRPSSATKLS